MIRPLSQTLTALIAIAESLVTRSRYSSLMASDQFVVVASEVYEADKRPAEGQRTTNAAMVMVIAIQAFRATEEEPGSPWLMLIGATLPLLRTDAWLAFNQEKAPQQETRR